MIDLGTDVLGMRRLRPGRKLLRTQVRPALSRLTLLVALSETT